MEGWWNFTTVIFIILSQYVQGKDLFGKFEIVEELREATHKEVSKNSNKNLYKDEVEYLLKTKSNDFHFNLKRNSDIIGPDFFETYQNGKFKNIKHRYDCNYQGKLKNNEGDVSMSLCDGHLQGIIVNKKSNISHYIEYNPNLQKYVVYDLSKDLKVLGQIHRNGAIFNDSFSPDDTRKRQIDLSGVEKYVSFALVVDHTLFVRLNENKEEVLQFVFKLINHVDFVYRQANIRIILTNLEVWKDKDKFEVTSQAYDNLSKFARYTALVLEKQHKWRYDNMQFLVGGYLENGYVGLGQVGTLCVGRYSIAIVHARNLNPLVTSNTVAHEFGHSFGLQHINPNCNCANKPCVMTSYVSNSPVNGLSDCSIRMIEKRCKEGYCSCLIDKPQMTVFGPLCGNGFVDGGEECDCGTPEQCTNPCCDASTCKLKLNAECAEGECCNVECKVIPKGTVCRQSTGECDITETCDGVQSICPFNIHVHNYEVCQDNKSFCHNGVCVPSLDDQCKSMWGKNAHHGMCYGKNLEGTKYGHCGKDGNGDFIACEKKDENCGKLQCYGDNLPAYIIYGSGRSTSKYGISGGILCRSGITNGGRGILGLTLALNGSKCGDRKVCSNQHCIDLSSQSESYCRETCGRHGKCTNVGLCYCNPGFKCPDCLSADMNNVNGMLCGNHSFIAPKEKINYIGTRKWKPILSNTLTKATDPSPPPPLAATKRMKKPMAPVLKQSAKRVGCRGRSGEILENLRTYIVWKNFKVSAEKIIHECAKIAEEKGYKGYGIIFYGECWGYSEPLKTIQRGGCINTEFKECTQDDTICVGDENSAFIYMFDDKVGI